MRPVGMLRSSKPVTLPLSSRAEHAPLRPTQQRSPGRPSDPHSLTSAIPASLPETRTSKLVVLTSRGAFIDGSDLALADSFNC